MFVFNVLKVYVDVSNVDTERASLSVAILRTFCLRVLYVIHVSLRICAVNVRDITIRFLIINY